MNFIHGSVLLFRSLVYNFILTKDAKDYKHFGVGNGQNRLSFMKVLVSLPFYGEG
jgi:hypothetical protein